MKAGKAYITSLGTTGLLVASSVMLLVVVGTLIAFDGWPSTDAHAPPETVAIGEGDAERVVAKRRIARERRALDRRDGRARARTDSGGRTAGDADDRTPAGAADPIISELPAPDSRPGTRGGGTRGGADDDPAGGGSRPGEESAGEEAVDHVGDAVSGVSPQAGGAIGQTGDAVGETIEHVVPVVPELVTGPRP